MRSSLWVIVVPPQLFSAADHSRAGHLRMVWVRSGTAKKTPKNASAPAHASSCPVDSVTPPCGGFSSSVSLLRGHRTQEAREHLCCAFPLLQIIDFPWTEHFIRNKQVREFSVGIIFKDAGGAVRVAGAAAVAVAGRRRRRHLRAGTTPTKPAASGIVAVATAVVCTMTFSATVKSFRHPNRCPALNTPKPVHRKRRLFATWQPMAMPGTSIAARDDAARSFRSEGVRCVQQEQP